MDDPFLSYNMDNCTRLREANGRRGKSDDDKKGVEVLEKDAYGYQLASPYRNMYIPVPLKEMLTVSCFFS